MFSWYVRDEEEWENVNKCQQKSFHNFHSVCHVSGVICSSDFTAITTVMVIVTESWHVTVRRHVFLSRRHQMGQNNQHCFDWTRTLSIKIWEKSVFVAGSKRWNNEWLIEELFCHLESRYNLENYEIALWSTKQYISHEEVCLARDPRQYCWDLFANISSVLNYCQLPTGCVWNAIKVYR